MLEGFWRGKQWLQVSEKTWKALTDEAKRLRTAREGID